MINGNILVEDLVNEYPELVGPLAKMGVICIACGEPIWGTLAELIESKGYQNSDDIYTKINEIIENKKNG